MAEKEERNVFTAEGLKRLQDELAERQTTISAEISERLKEAKAQGDLSENSEYDEALDAQAKNMSRMQELIQLLKNAEVIDDDEISKTKVSLGCTVVIREEETKTEETYTLVSSNEEDIFNNRISIDSPVGQAIKDKKKGQVVEVTTPAGSFKYKVMKIGK